MREIKFRAWDKKEKKLCLVSVLNLEKGGFLLGNSPTPIQWIGDKSYINEIPDGHFVYFEDMELMQFTGLHDKNGKEIWEGDLLKTSDPYGENEKIFPVEFVNGAYQLRWDSMFNGGDCDITTIGFAKDSDFTFEVIGNIYENPELIKSNTHEKNK